MHSKSEPERRRLTRHSLTLPLMAGGVLETTVNVSVSGVLFEGPLLASVGESIDFSLVITARPVNALRLHCRGRVVRTAPSGRGMQVAATIDSIENEC